MLPPGHIAAGYLVSYGLLSISPFTFSANQTEILLLAGSFFGFAPDLDMFYAFSKAHGFTIPGKHINHRRFITHAPLLWFLAAMLVVFFSRDPFVIYLGILIWLGSWSHFLLDSFNVGIMWLWPFSNELLATRNAGKKESNPVKGFFSHWIWMVNHYIKTSRITFCLEIVLILISVFILLNSIVY